MNTNIKSRARLFYRWEYFWLFLIILASLAAHFAVINSASGPILDEWYYIKDTGSILDNHETLRIEHPPLAKLLIAGGIKLFGDNPWGWRVLPVLFGTAAVILFYLLCRGLNMTRTASSIAAFLLAFENLFFLMGSVAMLDVYYVTFMMAGFLLYVRKRYVGSGIAIGLSTASKLSGFFGGLTVVIDWIYSSRHKRNIKFVYTVILAVITFIGVMVLLDFVIVQQASDFLNPVKRIIDMLGLTGGLTFSYANNPAAVPPWEWLYTYKPLLLHTGPNILGSISYSVWILIIPAFAYLIYRVKKQDEAGLFGLAWFVAAYLIWIPVALFTQRATFFYYFYPAVGAVCLSLGIALSQLIGVFRNRPRGKIKWLALSAVVTVLAAHVISFLVLSPLLPVDFVKLLGITTIP